MTEGREPSRPKLATMALAPSPSLVAKQLHNLKSLCTRVDKVCGKGSDGRL